MFITQHLTAYKVKLLILGASNSGKISFCSKYTSGFSKSFEESIGVDIFVREEPYPDGEDITFSCWVCAPERRFKYYWPKFFRGATGVFIIFDVTSRKSFNEVLFWYKTVTKNLGLIPMILLGNKVDRKDERVIKFEEVSRVARQLGFAAYLDISVKENINLAESFELINEIIYDFINSEKKEFHPDDLDPNIKEKIKQLSFEF